MKVDPDNQIVKLCAEGMQLEAFTLKGQIYRLL